MPFLEKLISKSKFLERFKNKSDRPPLPFFLLALVLLPFVESYHALRAKVYRGRHSTWRVLLGAALAVGGAVYAAHWVGWTLDYGWYLWLPATVIGYLVVYCYIWPLLYLCIVHPAYKLIDWTYNTCEKLIKERFGPITAAITKAISTVCVGSGKFWNRVLQRDSEGVWLIDTLQVLTGAGSIAAAGYLSWQVGSMLNGVIELGIIGLLASIAVGLTVLGFCASLSFNLIDNGKVQFIALIAGGAATYGLLPLIGQHFHGWTFYPAAAAVFIVSVGYIFPLVILALTDKFLAKVWKAFTQSIESTYNESNPVYASFVHHLANLLATAGLGYGLWTVLTSVGMPIGISAAATAIGALLGYINIFKLIHHSGGNAILGSIAAVVAGFLAAQYYLEAGWIFGIVGGVIAGIVAALLVGLAIIPPIYVSLRYINIMFTVTALEDPLASVYTGVNAKSKRTLASINNLCQDAYDDETGYQDLFTHVVNIAIAVLAFVGLFSMNTIFGIGGILALAITVLIPVLSYLIVGRLLIKSESGTVFISVALSLIAGGLAWAHLPAGDATVLFFVVKTALTLAATGIAFLIVIPTGYLLLQLITGPKLVGWLKPLLSKIHEYCWARFVDLCKLVHKAYKAIVKPFLKLVDFLLSMLEKAYNLLLKPFARLLARAYEVVRKLMAPLLKKLAAAIASAKSAYQHVIAVFKHNKK